MWGTGDVLRRDGPFLLRLRNLSLETTRIFESHVQKVDRLCDWEMSTLFGSVGFS